MANLARQGLACFALGHFQNCKKRMRGDGVAGRATLGLSADFGQLFQPTRKGSICGRGVKIFPSGEYESIYFIDGGESTESKASRRLVRVLWRCVVKGSATEK